MSILKLGTIALLDIVLNGNKLQVGDPETCEVFLPEVDLDTPNDFTLIIRFGATGVKSIVVEEVT